MEYIIVQYSTLQDSTVQYSKVQYRTVQYNAVQYVLTNWSYELQSEDKITKAVRVRYKEMNIS